MITAYPPERGDEGHSLLEAAVALTLLIALIVPAGGALALLLANRPAADYLAAAAQVESAIEEAISRGSFSDSTWTAADPGVLFFREARKEDGLVWLSVGARRATSGRPITSLHTIVLDRDR